MVFLCSQAGVFFLLEIPTTMAARLNRGFEIWICFPGLNFCILSLP